MPQQRIADLVSAVMDLVDASLLPPPRNLHPRPHPLRPALANSESQVVFVLEAGSAAATEV